MKKYFLISSLFLMACSPPFLKDRSLPVAQHYKASYEETWAAALKSLKGYSLKINNPEAGKIITEWKPGKREKTGQPDNKFQLTIRLTKTGEKTTKVNIQKSEQVYEDVEGWQAVSSDQVLEKVLLYRIGRLIFLEKFLVEND